VLIGELLRYPILNVPVDVQTFEQAISQLETWLQAGESRFVSTCTVYTLMVAQDDLAAMRALQNADMVTTDGMPLVWLQKQAGFAHAERVYGPDLFLALCARTENQHLRHFFLGGSPGVAEKLAQVLQVKYPGIEIAGFEAPAVSASVALDAQLVERLNASGAQLIWVGLGSPKQDIWMDVYRPHLRAPLLVGVGAAFDFLTGTKKQAPRWIMRAGLEWLFRLVTEPRRLWKRYLVYNSRFVCAILIDRIRTSLKQRAVSTG
jgi:N-acetylglucosaminyldiphosphoundecaprenol N-acetyl-beta-D-mannosaminyltransferase